MNAKFVVALVVFLYAEILCICNDRPIIGIIAEELNGNTSTGKSFIMAFYVKYIEASGARVVPIQIYQSREYYQDILSKINGVLIPGGGDIWNSKGFGRTGKLVIEIATELNEKGDYFPVWGTCLGFELLNLVAAKKMWMTACSADDWPTNIEFVKGFDSSRMFSNLTREMETMMLEEKVAIHFHHWCFTPKNYSVSGLDKYFKVLATNKDSNGETFVSIIEAYNWPFYGVTFHPEKILFDWADQNISTPHSAEAVRTSQFFSRFFVSEVRKNLHQFSSKLEENSKLIYNFNPEIAGEEPSAQMYIFS